MLCKTNCELFVSNFEKKILLKVLVEIVINV